jgi:hypothetical protein
VKPRAGLSLLADTFFVKAELTAHGYHLTSQRGSLSEEGRDQDQSITDRLAAEFEGFEHRQKEEFQGYEVFRADTMLLIFHSCQILIFCFCNLAIAAG